MCVCVRARVCVCVCVCECVCVYKEDLALNDLQELICHKTQPKQILYTVASKTKVLNFKT